MQISEAKAISRIKRSADQITSLTDIIPDDSLLNFSKKIFFHRYQSEYAELNLSLYDARMYHHPLYPNIRVQPHFIRDDGAIIYLDIIQAGTYIQSTNLSVIHLAMEILKIKTAILYTIKIKSSIKKKNLIKVDVSTDKFIEEIYSEKIVFCKDLVKDYLASVPKKKIRLGICDVRDPIVSDQLVKGFDSDQWISATKTRNYVMNNTLVDWLDMYGTSKKVGTKSKFKSTDDFTQFIMDKGIKFEKKVMDAIRKKFKSTEYTEICTSINNFDSNVLTYEKRTIKAIRSQIPIIYQPVLLNRSGKLSHSYGIPDLLVRSDYLQKIIENSLLISDKVYYVVVDIKWTTIELCADGIRIRNSQNFPAYKCQLYVYNHALGLIQGYEPGVSYILGRKYKYESSGTKYVSTDCFDRLGHIRYDSWDNMFIDETIGAIKWIKKLRSEGFQWTLWPKPSVPELYPNMCIKTTATQFDSWSKFKESYAKKIGEITMLWSCGIGNRLIAHANGIYSYTDKNCSADKLGIRGSIKKPILNSIIAINQKKKFRSEINKIDLKINQSVPNQWLDDPFQPIRLTVDFESINNIFDDFSTFPLAYDTTNIFMIGLSYKILNKSAKYKMWVVSDLSSDAQSQLFQQFYDFVRYLTDMHIGKESEIPVLYHWGHFEKSQTTSICQRLNMHPLELKFCDLSVCFRSNPIVINGCFGFGLKEISKRLYELGLIKTTWEKNNPCAHGMNAMLLAHKSYVLSKKKQKDVIKLDPMKNIISYNKIDCMVLHDIIDLLIKKARILDIID